METAPASAAARRRLAISYRHSAIGLNPIAFGHRHSAKAAISRQLSGNDTQ
jgi:hypothetical protein